MRQAVNAGITPLPVNLVNDVVFTLATGQYSPSTSRVSTAERIKRSMPAVVYALDARTGNELWTSGPTITSFASSVGLWTSVGQVHVATQDGTIYTFGFPMERY